MSNVPRPAGRPPIPLIELVRRLLLFMGALAAVFCLLYPPPAVIRVGVPNFRQMKREQAQAAAAAATAPSTQSLQAFIDHTTKTHLREVSGPQWLEFYQSIAMADDAKTSPLVRHLGSDIGANYHYFRTDEPMPVPLNEGLQAKGTTYVKVEGGGYLELARMSSRDAARHAPAAIAFPWRYIAPWLLAAGIAGYALLPWPSAGRNILRYAVGRAVIIPDLVGTALACLLFALPMLIVSDAAKEGFPLLGIAEGWIWLTLGFWLLAALSLGCVVFGLWYASASVCVGETGIVATNLIRAKRCSFDEIASLEPAVFQIPRWLSMAMYFASVVDSHRGPAASTGRDAYGAALRLRDGRTIRLIFTHLVGVEGLLAQLKQRGIAVSQDLVAMFGDEEYLTRTPAFSFWRTRAFGLAVAGMIIVACVAAALMPAEGNQPRARMPELLSEEDVVAQEALLVRMKDLQAEMSALLKKIESAPVAQRAQLLDQYKILAAKYEVLSRDATQLGAETLTPDK